MKTTLHQLIDQLSTQFPQLKYGNAIDKNFWLEKEKQELCKFWIEGNNQGWAMATDFPEDSEYFYSQTYKETVKSFSQKVPKGTIDDLPF